MGFHLVETPGQAFPQIPGTETSSRQSLFNDAKKRMKPGDIILISRLYLTRTNPVKTQDSLMDKWLPTLSDFVNNMEKQGLIVVVAGPPPLYQFPDIRACRDQSFNSCSIPRQDIAPVIDDIYGALHIIAKSQKNLKILNVFEQLCPSQQNRCYPGIDRHMTMRDRDHLNVYGSELLEQTFMELVSLKFTNNQKN